MLPFVSLLPPQLALSLLPLHFPAPTSLSQSGVYHSGWIRAPYLDAVLSLLCTATGETKTLNPYLLASLLLSCIHIYIHTHSHTHLCLFAFSQPRKETAVLFLSLNALIGRLEGSKLTLVASISQHTATANLLPLPASSRQHQRQAVLSQKPRTRGDWKVFLLQRYLSAQTLHAPNCGHCQ